MDHRNHRRTRTIQMKYPAPYSQSWANTDAEVIAPVLKKKTSLQGKGRKLTSAPCQGCPQRQFPPGCDPYAPHLKYGLFTRKRPQLTEDERSKYNPGAKTSELEYCKKDERRFSKKGSNPEAPLFVIRPLVPRFTRQLSASEVMHVDIKPRNPLSLSRRVSPEYRVTSPRNTRNRIKRFG